MSVVPIDICKALTRLITASRAGSNAHNWQSLDDTFYLHTAKLALYTTIYITLYTSFLDDTGQESYYRRWKPVYANLQTLIRRNLKPDIMISLPYENLINVPM